MLDADGLLHHVGFSSGIKAKDKPALTDKLEAVKNVEVSRELPRKDPAAGRQTFVRMAGGEAELRCRGFV